MPIVFKISWSPKPSKATKKRLLPELIQKFWLTIPEFKTRIDYFNDQPGMENTGQGQYLFSFARLKGSMLRYEYYLWKCNGLWKVSRSTYISWCKVEFFKLALQFPCALCQWFISLILYFEQTLPIFQPLHSLFTFPKLGISQNILACRLVTI